MTASRETRFSLRVVTSPFNPNGLAVSRHVIRVAVDPLTPEVPSLARAVWTGSAWVNAPIKVFNGTAFVNATSTKTWNGTSWV